MCRWLGKHPNIISLKDLIVDMEEDTLYVCMEVSDESAFVQKNSSIAAGRAIDARRTLHANVANLYLLLPHPCS